MGNAGVKAATASDPNIGSAEPSAPKLATPSQQEIALSEQIQQVCSLVSEPGKMGLQIFEICIFPGFHIFDFCKISLNEIWF